MQRIVEPKRRTSELDSLYLFARRVEAGVGDGHSPDCTRLAVITENIALSTSQLFQSSRTSKSPRQNCVCHDFKATGEGNILPFWHLEMGF